MIYFRNSNSTRSERIKSEGDIKITKGKNNISLGKKCTVISDSINDNDMDATMLTQVIEHDHTEDTREYSLLHKSSRLEDGCNRLITNFQISIYRRNATVHG